MHEVSLALSVLDIVVNKCQGEGYQAIDSVRVKLGRATNILPEAFAFAFDVVKQDTIAQKAKFILDLVPLGGVCNQCGKDFELEVNYILECPLCSSPSFKIHKGYEMEVVEMEVN